jgi:hypothetical protein
MTSTRLFMHWFWFRVALVRWWAGVRWFVAPEHSARRFQRRFSELPRDVQRKLLAKHGRTSL